MKNKTTQSELIKSEPVIINASVTSEKMEAIVNLSQAVLELAKTLNGVHTTVSIANCRIEGAIRNGIEINS